ncbi:MAG: hypothetical protein WC227_04665 [Patescibacteria group bacterium]|jgi:hypothetical protein
MERLRSGKIGNQLKPHESVTIKGVFVFLSFIFLIFLSFIFYLRFSGFSPMVEIYKLKKPVVNFNLADYLTGEANTSISKNFEIKINEEQLKETIKLGDRFIDLKKPDIKIKPEGVIITGKSSGGFFGINVEVLAIPEADAGKLKFKIKEIKAAGVVAPPRIADPLTSQINLALRDVAVPEGLTVTEVRTMTGYILVEGTKK